MIFMHGSHGVVKKLAPDHSETVKIGLILQRKGVNLQLN